MFKYSQLCALNRLLIKTEFKWEEICPGVFAEPKDAVLFLNSMIDLVYESRENENVPRPELKQLDPDNKGGGVWDGFFGMINEKPVYIGTDEPCGGSGGPELHVYIQRNDLISFT